eukprot:389869_1
MTFKPINSYSYPYKYCLTFKVQIVQKLHTSFTKRMANYFANNLIIILHVLCLCIHARDDEGASLTDSIPQLLNETDDGGKYYGRTKRHNSMRGLLYNLCK